MLCIDVPPPGVLFDIVDVDHLHQGDLLIDIQRSLFWFDNPRDLLFTHRNLVPNSSSTFSLSTIRALLSADLPRCYWNNISSPSVNNQQGSTLHPPKICPHLIFQHYLVELLSSNFLSILNADLQGALMQSWHFYDFFSFSEQSLFIKCFISGSTKEET